MSSKELILARKAHMKVDLLACLHSVLQTNRSSRASRTSSKKDNEKVVSENKTTE